MKNTIFQYLTVLFLLPIFASCDKTDGNYANLFTICTVKQNTANDYYFILDDNTTLYPSDKSLISYYDAKDGQRVITRFRFSSVKTEGYTYSAKIYTIDNIYQNDATIVSAQEELDKLKDDKIDYYGYILSSLNYLNLGIGFAANDVSKHSFDLIRNDLSQIDPQYIKDGYLNLELRHNNDNDSSGSIHQTYISFKMDALKSDLSGKIGIILRVNSLTQNKIKYYQIEFPKEK